MDSRDNIRTVTIVESVFMHTGYLTYMAAVIPPEAVFRVVQDAGQQSVGLIRIEPQTASLSQPFRFALVLYHLANLTLESNLLIQCCLTCQNAQLRNQSVQKDVVNKQGDLALY